MLVICFNYLAPGWDFSREPGSQAPTKSCRNSRFFGANLTSRYFRISCQMKEFFLSHTTCRKYFLVTGRNILTLQVIDCRKKKFLVQKRNFFTKGKKLSTQGALKAEKFQNGYSFKYQLVEMIEESQVMYGNPSRAHLNWQVIISHNISLLQDVLFMFFEPSEQVLLH